jgi:hypothetical protein
VIWSLQTRSFLAVAALIPALAQGEGPVIDHRPIGCVEAGHFPRVTARFGPPAAISRARLFFRAGGTPNWYYLGMQAEGNVFSGVLPRPGKSLKRVEYYVEATDKALVTTRSAEFSAAVVAHAGECPAGESVAVALTSGPSEKPTAAAPGGPSSPPGFWGEGHLGTKTLLIGGAVLGGVGVGLLASRTTPNHAPTLGGIEVKPAIALQETTRVSFYARNASDPDGDALTYVWSFGDATSAVGASVDHRFDSPGVFSVRLRVTDQKLQFAEATAPVTVKTLRGTWLGQRTPPPSATSQAAPVRVTLELQQGLFTMLWGTAFAESDSGRQSGTVLGGSISEPASVHLNIAWVCPQERSATSCLPATEDWSGDISSDFDSISGSATSDGAGPGTFQLGRGRP